MTKQQAKKATVGQLVFVRWQVRRIVRIDQTATGIVFGTEYVRETDGKGRDEVQTSDPTYFDGRDVHYTDAKLN